LRLIVALVLEARPVACFDAGCLTKNCDEASARWVNHIHRYHPLFNSLIISPSSASFDILLRVTNGTPEIFESPFYQARVYSKFPMS
jgi:hypothetical protein